MEGGLVRETYPDHVRRGLSLQARPHLRPSYRLAGFTDRFGGAYWILKGAGESYMSLNPAELFLLQQIDGQRTVSEINMEYLRAKRALGDRLLYELLVKLQAGGLLEEPLLEIEAPKPPSQWDTLWRDRHRLGPIDPLATGLYRRGGRLLFTRWGACASLLLICGGVLGFVLQLSAGGGRYLLLPAFSGWEVIGLWLTLPFCMAVHEMAHALACRAQGVKLGEWGIIMSLGMPLPYINTSDAWMAPPGARVLVSAAGPWSSLLIAALGVILSYAFAGSQAFWLRLAAFNYLLTLVNLNPWVESDGYFMLMDYMNVPGLRKSARRFMRKELAGALARGWSRLTSRQRLFIGYWTGSLAYSVIITPIITAVIVISIYRVLVSLLEWADRII